MEEDGVSKSVGYGSTFDGGEVCCVRVCEAFFLVLMGLTYGFLNSFLLGV